jgi:phage gp46-like protein
MTDLALFWDNTLFGADLALVDGQLATDDGLRSAIIISLFTDRRAADDDELPEPGADWRGWWADDISEVDGDLIGSRLWLLRRSKLTSKAIGRARDYAREAVAWLIADGVCREIDIATAGIRPDTLAIGITFVRPNGARGRFDFTWDATAMSFSNAA